MKKVLALLLIVGAIIPSISSSLSAEASVSPEGVHRRRRPRCKTRGGVTVCRMPRHRKPKRCGIMPCIPRGYFRPNPPRRVPLSPMPLR